MNATLQPWTPEEYHTDPGETPSLSASIAHALISRSPLHAWAAHPKLGGQTRVASGAMDRGSVIHRLLLGKGADYAALPYEDFRKKEAQQARDEAIKAGRVPIKAADFKDCEASADAVRAQLRTFGVDLEKSSALREQAVTFESEGVACRCMMDCLDISAGVIIDLKSTNDAHPEKLRRKMVDYGYDIQEAAYTEALLALDADLAGRSDFLFVFVETDAPFAVQPVYASGAMRELGQSKWRRAVSTWRQCLATNTWPSYSRGAVYVDPMPWALSPLTEDAA